MPLPGVKIPGSRKAGALAIAAALVAGAEGLRTVAYKDPVGIPTLCFGETRNVKPGDTATIAQCRALLAERLNEFSAGVDRCLTTRVPDESHAAFLSFAYNVGTGAFCKSTLVRKANAGDVTGACNEILRWDHAKGIRLPGLTRRRQKEQALCLKGVTAAETL